MKTILVDDEVWATKEFSLFCENHPDIDLLGVFTDPIEALGFAEDNVVDLAFLDIEMPAMKGTELAQSLRDLYPNIIIVFVSAYDQYMREAFNMQADYFLTKPYSHEDMENVVARAKLLSARISKRIFIQTFGKFELFVEGKPMHYSVSKSTELLAFLVDKRGTFVSAQEAFNAIWANKPYNNYTGAAYRKALARLQEMLNEADCGSILLRESNGIAVDPTAFDCDYYQFLDGDPNARAAFRGEYMSQYKWAKPTEEHLKELAQD